MVVIGASRLNVGVVLIETKINERAQRVAALQGGVSVNFGVDDPFTFVEYGSAGGGALDEDELLNHWHTDGTVLILPGRVRLLAGMFTSANVFLQVSSPSSYLDGHPDWVKAYTFSQVSDSQIMLYSDANKQNEVDPVAELRHGDRVSFVKYNPNFEYVVTHEREADVGGRPKPFRRLQPGR